MQQLIQNLKTGVIRLETIPMPQVQPGQVLIQTRRSLVSLGTERMLVEFGQAGLFAKARSQPDKVRQVLEKIQADGLRPTLSAVFRKLDQPLPLGYCHVGVVMGVGEGVTDLRIGDRVASNGCHAEVVCVPRNLVARIPDGVSDDEAAFTVIGAIGLHGVRLINPTLDETIVVIGLGLIGLLTAQLLRINGCRVIGIDIDEAKCTLSRQQNIPTVNGADASDSVRAVLAMTDGRGADGVVITASAKNDTILLQAARISRQQGRIVLIGVVDMTQNRTEFQRKELSFIVSRSYGPGRYDDAYEQQGHDYPLPYVRWTANRNFQAILQLLASGQLNVKPLITEIVPFVEFDKIYGRIRNPAPTGSPVIASLMCYPETVSPAQTLVLNEHSYDGSRGFIGLIGAGNYASSTLLPALKTAGARVKIIASSSGLSGTLLARKFSIPESTTDYRQIITDPTIGLCIIATRHNSHARSTVEALQAGKHVFVEKPLAIYGAELRAVIDAHQASGKVVMVGFNRRFSPYSSKVKALLTGIVGSVQEGHNIPMNVVITVNAGSVPADSWIQDRAIGGGRIVGEVGHFIDLITFLTGSRVKHVCANGMGLHAAQTSDSVSLLLRYENGSTGVVNYFATGNKAYPKERVEVFYQGKTLVLDNFRRVSGYGFRGFWGMRGRQDKGHHALMQQLVAQMTASARGNALEPLIPFADLVNTTQTTLAALQSLQELRWIEVGTIGMEGTET